MSLAEPFVKPSTMLYRNFLAMEMRGAAAQPSDRRRGADGRLRQDHARPDHGRDQRWACRRSTCRPARCCAAIGAARRWAPARTPGNTGTRSAPAASARSDWNEIEGGIARSFGTCMVMGTAATMMAIAEALGLTLPGASSIPAPDANHPRMCAAAGRRIVEMVWEDLTPRANSDAGRLRQRHPRAHGAGRLDQRHHPCDRHGAPRRRRARHGALRRDFARGAGARQYPPVRANI